MKRKLVLSEDERDEFMSNHPNPERELFDSLHTAALAAQAMLIKSGKEDQVTQAHLVGLVACTANEIIGEMKEDIE